MAYALRQGKRGYTYPSPFMDISGTWYPTTVKDLFRWCKYYFYTFPIVRTIIYKCAEYPITDFIYEVDNKEADEKIREKSKDIIEDKLDLKSFLINVGLDFFSYGNCFVSFCQPFKRRLICPSCGERYDIENIKYSLKAFKFVISCDKCNVSNIEAKVEDTPINDPSGINLVRWNPENVQLDYNPITGKTVYYYRIPNKIRNDIVRGKRVVIDQTPIAILKALAEKKDLQLDADNLFHFKNVTLAEEDMGWGKPPIMAVIKDIFYYQTLRKSQEAISLQHIVPLDIVFPTSAGAMDPYTHINMAKWKDKVKEELRYWREDPNYISVMPVPVQVARVGGDGRALLLGPELEQTLRNIAAGLNVSINFIFGDMTYSGGSVYSRILENHFLTTREIHHRFIKWTVNKLIKIGMLSKGLSVRMMTFKMADDIQQKQLAFQYNQAGKLSDETMLSDSGYHYKKERRQIELQINDQNEINKKIAKAQAEAQGEAQIIGMNYQMRIQEEQQEAVDQLARKQNQKAMLNQMVQNKIQQSQMTLQNNAGVNPGLQTMQQDSQSDMQPMQEMPMQINWNDEAKKIAERANLLEPGERKEFLKRLKMEVPDMYEMVREYVKTGNITRGNIDMRPQPEVAPPRRNGST